MRAIVQGVVNAKGELPEADMKGILDQLNVPQLTHAAIQRRMQQIAEEQDRVTEAQQKAERNKLVAQAALKGHKVDPSVLQHLSDEEIDEAIELAEKDISIFQKIYDKIVGRRELINEEKIE